MEDIKEKNKQLVKIKNTLTQCINYEKSYVKQYHLYSYLYYYLKKLSILYDYISENDQYVADIIHIILKYKNKNYLVKTNGEKLEKLQKLKDEYIKQIQNLRIKVNKQFSEIKENNQFELLSIVLFVSDKKISRRANIDMLIDKKKKLVDVVKTDLKLEELISKNPIIRLIQKDSLIEKDILNLQISDILKLMSGSEPYIITLSAIVPMSSPEDIAHYIYDTWEHIELNKKTQFISIMNNYVSQILPTIKYHQQNKGITIDSIKAAFQKEFREEKLELSISLNDTRPILIYNSDYLTKLSDLSENLKPKNILEYLHMGENEAAKQLSPDKIEERNNIILITLGSESWYTGPLSFAMQQIYNKL